MLPSLGLETTSMWIQAHHSWPHRMITSMHGPPFLAKEHYNSMSMQIPHSWSLNLTMSIRNLHSLTTQNGHINSSPHSWPIRTAFPWPCRSLIPGHLALAMYAPNFYPYTQPCQCKALWILVVCTCLEWYVAGDIFSAHETSLTSKMAVLCMIGIFMTQQLCHSQ